MSTPEIPQVVTVGHLWAAFGGVTSGLVAALIALWRAYVGQVVSSKTEFAALGDRYIKSMESMIAEVKVTMSKLTECVDASRRETEKHTEIIAEHARQEMAELAKLRDVLITSPKWNGSDRRAGL